MAIHVPFSQRPSGRRHRQPPIYIGFDLPPRNRPKFNWWGFNGVFLFLLSLGLLSPITLLISVVGLRRRPRGLAIFGTLLSTVGLAVMVLIGVMGYRAAEASRTAHARALHQLQLAQQVKQGHIVMAEAAREFEQYRVENDGRLPLDLDGNALALKYVDPWEESLLYEANSDHAVLRSAGPDNNFFSEDDLMLRVDGITGEKPLLPVEEQPGD